MRKKGIVWKVIGLLLALVAVAAAAAFFWVKGEIKGKGAGGEEILITLKEGEGAYQVSQMLKEKNVVKSAYLFRKFSIKEEADKRFSPGEFAVQKGMGYAELCEVFTSQPKIKGEWFTVIEGKNLVEIGTQVETLGLGTKEEFIELINKDYGFRFEEFLDEHDLVLFRREGFAFPDTYLIEENTTLEGLAKAMLENFDKKFTQTHYDQMKKMGLNLRETIALASTIQEEAGVEEEMRKVSAVFHNRLKTGSGVPKLQSDVTVFYAQDVVEKWAKDNIKERMHAYDTYDTEGINVGAIANPGLDAIEAALYPADVDYLYFLTDKTGKYYYANTLEEHERYWQEALAINEKLENEG